MDEAAETHLEGRILLRLDERLLAAVEVNVNQKQPGLYARNVQGEHPRRVDVEGLPCLHERVPDRDGLFGRNPNLVAEVARVARARHVHADASYLARRDAKVFQALYSGALNEAP